MVSSSITHKLYRTPKYLRRRGAELLIILAFGSSVASESGERPITPPPPDYAEVLDQELRRAVAEDSNAALIGFIARHPNEALTEDVRRQLKARPTPDAGPRGGPDADIFMAFDLARLSRDPQAMAAFASRYAAHPLAAEASRPIWLLPD